MRHRAETMPVDSKSRATVRHRAPKHARWVNAGEMQQQQQEEAVYRQWCFSHGLDPEDTSSAIAYEGSVGWLYLD